MSTAYSPDAWSGLFTAATGASAALTGLVFVAVSVNLEHILGFQGLPERALQTLILLLSGVLVSLIVLIPGQDRTALGLELLGLSVAFAGAIGATLRHTLPGSREHERAAAHLALLLPGTLPPLAGSISLLAHTGGGIYWIAGGLLGAVAGACANAWVLLVEIRR